MILATRFVSDAKEDFQGGSALSVSWPSLLRRAARKLLGNVNPDNLKVRRAVYGGITAQQFVHYMPEDIVKPVTLYKNDNDRKWGFMPPKPFFAKTQTDKFTVAPVNGVRFLVVAHTEAGSTLVIDDMDTITSMGGTATPAVNSNDFVSGAAAVQASFTDAGLYLSRTLTTALNVSEYLRGTVFVPVRLSEASSVASIKLRLQTDAGNYYEVSSDNDDINDSLVDGWNFVRFSMENRATTGAPTDSNITAWRLTITTTTGLTITAVIDRMTLQKNAPLWLEGYSDRIFVDGTTGAAKSDVSTTSTDGDYVNVDEELADILHYELCLLVEQAGDASKDGNSSSAFAAQLKRAYANYFENHPSEEEPLSYNIAPELNRETPLYDRGWDDVNFRDSRSNA